MSCHYKIVLCIQLVNIDVFFMNHCCLHLTTIHFCPHLRRTIQKLWTTHIYSIGASLKYCWLKERKKEDQNWDQYKRHAMPVYGSFRCRSLLVIIMYVCLYCNIFYMYRNCLFIDFFLFSFANWRDSNESGLPYWIN